MLKGFATGLTFKLWQRMGCPVSPNIDMREVWGTSPHPEHRREPKTRVTSLEMLTKESHASVGYLQQVHVNAYDGDGGFSRG